MKWRITFLTLLFSVFCSLFVSSSTYAVSDISVTYTQGTTFTNWQAIFPDCDSYCLSDYHLLIVDASSTGRSPTLRVSFDNNYSFTQNIYSDYNIFTYPFENRSNNVLAFSDSPFNSFPFDVTYTLTNDLPENCSESPLPPSGTYFVTENGTYDISEYEYVDVDVPATETPGDYDDEFNGVIVAIYTCGAIILVIYFFYCIYRMIIKTAGGV